MSTDFLLEEISKILGVRVRDYNETQISEIIGSLNLEFRNDLGFLRELNEIESKRNLFLHNQSEYLSSKQAELNKTTNILKSLNSSYQINTDKFTPVEKAYFQIRNAKLKDSDETSTVNKQNNNRLLDSPILGTKVKL